MKNEQPNCDFYANIPRRYLVVAVVSSLLLTCSQQLLALFGGSCAAFARLLFVSGLKASQHQQEINARGKEGLSDDLFIQLDWKTFAGFLVPLLQVLMVMPLQSSFSVSFIAMFTAGGENINEGYGTISNNLKEKKHNKGKKSTLDQVVP